jgi:hypothetical protein
VACWCQDAGRENQGRWRSRKNTAVTYRVGFGLWTRTRCARVLVWVSHQMAGRMANSMASSYNVTSDKRDLLIDDCLKFWKTFMEFLLHLTRNSAHSDYSYIESYLTFCYPNGPYSHTTPHTDPRRNSLSHITPFMVYQSLML